jgi:hypothetical protein
MIKPDKSKTMDAAEKLMLDLMEKHPGASKSSLLALSKTSQGTDQRCCEPSLAIL